LRARLLTAALLVALALLGSNLTARGVGDLQSRIAAGKSAAQSLQTQISQDTAQIAHTTTGLNAAEARLSALQGELSVREAQLVKVQDALLAAREHLLYLENRLRVAASALSANLVDRYEGGQPDFMSVVLDSNGFKQLLEQMNFLERVGHQDASVIKFTRVARLEVEHEATTLAALESRDKALTEQVLAQRNQVAALQAALLHQQIAEESARSGASAKLSSLNSKLHQLEAQAAAEAARAADTGNANVGGIAVDTGGMVQAPAGAPAAVAEVIAAGNAIATLPYIYGGGHASFHADGYDCSGSVSYALAAAGLVSSPMVSGQFEDWGDPGPGRWITIYANADHVWMTVAGWRFDTVALAESGTRWAQGGGEFSGFVVRHPPGL
jgi:cell wall-associated NlpC family hydrolase